MAQDDKTKTTGLESIDRLEEKIKLLVNTIVAHQGRADPRRGRERQAARREIDGLKARINTAESAGAEVTSLREERDLIKSRVSDMLQAARRL